MIAMIAMATRLTQPECAIEAQHVSQLSGCLWMRDPGPGIQGGQKSLLRKSPTNKNVRFASVVRKIRGHFFFEFLMQQSPRFKFIRCDDDGLSKAHIVRHSSPTPLLHVITSMVANRAPSVPIRLPLLGDGICSFWGRCPTNDPIFWGHLT